MGSVADSVGLGVSLAVVGVSTKVATDAMRGINRKPRRCKKRKRR